MEKKSKKTIFKLFIYLLIDLISFACILPVLPSLVQSFSLEENDILYNTMSNFSENFRSYINAPINNKWNIVLFGGLLGSSFSICQFVCSPIIGALSDVFGRKSMLILTSTGMLISYLIWCVSSNNFTIFFISRIVGGICKANIGIAIAIVGDVYGETNRNSGMAVVGIAFSLGFIIGPLVGVIAGSFVNVAMVSSGLTVVNLIFVLWFFNETLPKEKRDHSISSKLSDICQFINPISIFLYSPMKNLKYRDLRKVRLLGFVYFTYFAEQGRMYLFLGVVMILIQGGIVRRLKSGGEKIMILMGILTLIPSFILLGFSQNILHFYIGLFLFAFASSCVIPCLTSLVSHCDNDKSPQQGRLMGLLRSQGCLARGLGPLFASIIFWMCGPHLAYAIGSVLMLIPLAGMLSIFKLYSN